MPVGPDVVKMAECDAQHIGAIEGASFANDSEPDEKRCEYGSTAGPASATRAGAHVSAGARQSSASLEYQTTGVDSSATLEQRATVERDSGSASQTNAPASAARALPRARQTIPPALRRAVFLRDQRCCQVPGCSNAGWIDVHHIELRSEGGRHSLENLVCVCAAHHRAIHHGGLRLSHATCGSSELLGRSRARPPAYSLSKPSPWLASRWWKVPGTSRSRLPKA